MKQVQTKTACGAIFVSQSSGRVLLNLRAPYKSHALTWGLWGGMVEQGETPIQCLRREVLEEVGFLPDVEKINPFDIFTSRDGHFTFYSYICVVSDEFIPKINQEAVGYCWTRIGTWPSPMHEGAKCTLCNADSADKILKILNNSIDHEKHNIHKRL